MRGIVLFLLVPAFLLPPRLQAATVLRVGVYQNRPHVFIDRSGKPRGLFIDILEHIAHQEGWQIDYRPGSWSQCLIRLQNDDIDLLPAISYSEERARRYAFNEDTVIVNWSTVYARRRSGIETVIGLKNKRIAVVGGDISTDALRGRLNRFAVQCEFIEVEGFPEAMELVHSGKADAGLVGRLFGAQHQKLYGLEPTPIICSPMQLRFAAPKSNDERILAAIDRHIAELRKDRQSVYYRAMTRWVLPLEEWDLPHWVLWILTGVVALLVVLAALGFFLRVQVHRKTAELAHTNEDLRAEIAERIRAEKSLRESERRFHGLFERTFGFLGLLSADGTVLELNRPTLEFTGLKREDVVGRPLWEVDWSGSSADADARLKAAVGRAAAGEFVRYEFEVTGKRNRKETLDFSIKPVKDEKNNVTMLIAEARDISRIKKTRQMLLQYQQDLRALTLKLPLAEERERKRLAAALHDSVIQSLSLSRIKLGSLSKQVTDKESRDLLRDLRKMFDAALIQMRTLTFELSPPVLYELGLGAAIEWLGDELEKKHRSVTFSLQKPETPPAIEEVVNILLFQSVRELLTNIGKHAKARNVSVGMEVRRSRIVITVQDDGRGFDVESVSGYSNHARSFGLFSIRERMRQVGGSFELKSNPGKGTVAVLEAPLNTAPPEGAQDDHQDTDR